MENIPKQCKRRKDIAVFNYLTNTILAISQLIVIIINNNNLHLLQLQSNRTIIHYQHSPHWAGNNSRHAGQHYVQKGC